MSGVIKSEITGFRHCKCGYSILVYETMPGINNDSYHVFFDGHSGNYEQTYTCPGCHDYLDYLTLEG